MSRPRLVSTVVVLAAALVLTANVQASQSQPVTITVLTTQAGTDAFTATGGVVCSSGTVSNAWVRFVGYQNGSGVQILIDKYFECADGTFDILLRVSLDFSTCDTVATWSVLDGNGAYERLRGAGSLTGTSSCDDTILDAYVGAMHID
jgi:hypothetical protein